MIDLMHPYGTAVTPYVASVITTHVARESWEIASYYALRRQIFVAEQGLFRADDRDEHDRHATPIVAMSMVAGMADEVVGMVRIYETEPGVWYGGRLGVHRRYRRRATIGASLIRKAVTTAHAWGCQCFMATVQERNVDYFTYHHFQPLAPVIVCGAAHYLMSADLSYFPPDPAAPRPAIRIAA